MTMGTDRAVGTWTELGRVLGAVVLLVAVAACATSGGAGTSPRAASAAAAGAAPTYKAGGGDNREDPYRFVIAFDKDGCPASATPDVTNCPDAQPACIRVKGGQTVRFESTPPGTEFMISFDPFRKTWIPSSGGVFTVEAAMHGNGKAKPHTFIVTAAAKCDKPLDPQIILD